jgi:hypothetical protein
MTSPGGVHNVCQCRVRVGAVYARSAALRAERRACEIRLRAERKAGELDSQREKAKGATLGNSPFPYGKGFLWHSYCERRVDPASQISIFLVGLALLVAILGLSMR